MEYLNVNVPINTTIYPTGLYDWMRILAGGVSKFQEIRMQPGTGQLFDRNGNEILAGGGGGGAPVNATYILKSPDVSLPNAVALNTFPAIAQKSVLGLNPGGDLILRTQIDDDGLGKLLVGTNAGAGITTGQKNLLVGALSGQNMTTASFNTCVGEASGNGCVSGQNNVCFGRGTTLGATSENNVAIGTSTFLSGNSNIVIGGGASTGANNNSIAIGTNAQVQQSNSVNISSSTPLKVGINNTTPICTLDMKTSDAANCPVAVKFQAIPKNTIPFAALAANEGFLLTSNTDDANEAIIYYGNKSGIQRIPFSLAQLTDVSSGIQGATNGQVLTYNSTIQRWENQNSSGGTITNSAFKRQTNSFVCPPFVSTPINFNISVYDLNSNTSATQFTTPVNGIYSFVLMITITNPSATDFGVSITASTSGIIAQWRGNPNAISNSVSNETVLSISGISRLNASETVSCLVSCNASTTLDSSLFSGSIVRQL